MTARTLFAQQRAFCHGPDGLGDGPSSAILDPSPTDFHEVRPTTTYAESALACEVRDTAMHRYRPWIEAPKWQPLAWDEPVSSSDPAIEQEEGAS